MHLTYPTFRTIVDDRCAQGRTRGYLMQHLLIHARSFADQARSSADQGAPL
jgi:hypothetical protein